jgi:hypothetical protein
MTDLTIHALTELTSPSTSDELGIWDVSAAQYKRIAVSNLLGGTITGGGTIATGGYTLTVPATGTAALRNSTNDFTVNQSISVDTGDMAFAVTNASTASLAVGISSESSSAAAVGYRNYRVAHDGALRGFWTATSGESEIQLSPWDNGSGPGSHLSLRRNSNGATPAAGFVELSELDGTLQRIWPDNSGNLRIYNADPTNANDTSGTVVGTQTSMAAAKYLYSELSTIEDVLHRIADGAAAVRSFVYRRGSYNRQRFEGVITDYAPDYGMDRDEEHPAGKSLNEIQIMGDLLRAVEHLTRRVRQLEQLLPM